MLPSAAARRRAIRAFLNESPVAIGVATISRGRLLPTLELRAGLAPGESLPPEVERMLAREAGAAAGVPLFEGRGATARAPAGAVRAVLMLRQRLRLNGCTADDYAAAGGDPRAAEAVRIIERRRVELGFEDEAHRIRRLIDAGIPQLDLVIDEPHLPNRLAAELFEAMVLRSTSCAVGVAALQPEPESESAAEHTPLLTMLGQLGFVRVSSGRQQGDASVDMRVLGGAGVLDEVEYVAREMLARLRGGTGDPTSDHQARVSPHDLLGVAPTAAYRNMLHEACVRVGVPVASPRLMPVLDVPLVRALLETFRLLGDPELDTAERGLALLATPYAGPGLARGTVLARRLVLNGLGSLRSWEQGAEGIRRRSFRRFAAAVPELADRILSGSAPGDYALVITSCALDHGYLSNGRRYHLDSGRDDTVRLDQLGWDALTAAFERLDSAFTRLGVRQLSSQRWLQELEELLSTVTVRVESRAREGVHITVAGAGMPPAAHVYAIGWREGLVPRRTREEPLLPDRVKRALNEKGAHLELLADRAGVELERRERVRRAARESLTISWPAVDAEGNAQLPSFYMEDLGAPEAEVRSIGDPTWPLGIAATRAERVTRATILARHRVEGAVGWEAEGTREVLQSLSAVEHRRWSGAMHAGRRVELSGEVLAEAAPAASRMSASQAKVLVHCQFRHFGEQRLKLKRLEAPRVDALELGSIAHRVLAVAGREGWSDESVLEALEAERNRLKAPVLADPAARFELDRLGEGLLDLAAAERERLADGLAPARWFELGFGLHAEDLDPDSLPHGLTLQLPAGAAIQNTSVRGSIDRVDVFEQDGVRYGVALDYKLGSGSSYVKAMRSFEDFQLPIYNELMRKFGLEPAGVCYLGLRDGVRHGVMDTRFADRFVRADEKEVKRLDTGSYNAFIEERMAALSPAIVSLAAGEIAVEPRNGDCGYCEMRPVCRVGTFAAAFAGADEGFHD